MFNSFLNNWTNRLRRSNNSYNFVLDLKIIEFVLSLKVKLMGEILEIDRVHLIVVHQPRDYIFYYLFRQIVLSLYVFLLVNYYK